MISAMAIQTTVTVTDDLDGSANAKEVTFGWDGTCVNGQVAVPVGGQLKVPTLRWVQLGLMRVPPFARACRIR
jgi:hypothetical protein